MAALAQLVKEHAEAADRLGASLCGIVMNRPEWLDDLRELVDFEQFGLRPRRVWLTILRLHDSGKHVDPVAVGSEIDDFALAVEYHAGAIAVTSLEQARQHAEDLTERWRQFQVAELGDQLRTSALDTPSTHLLEKLEEEAARLRRGGKPAERVHLITVGEALEGLMKLADSPIYETPFPTLNHALGFGGLLGGQVYTVAAGTGIGKTTWVAAVAAFYAESGGDVLVATWEMIAGYFCARIAAGRLQVHSNQIIRNELPMRHVIAAIPQRIVFLERPPLDVLRRGAALLARKAKRPPLVIVDYVQLVAELVDAELPRADIRKATSMVSGACRRLAQELGCPVLAVSAASRGATRKMANDVRKLPPGDLVDVAKESGSIEYDGAALVVLSLSEDTDGDEQIATMTVAKSRFGEKLHIEARYNGRLGIWRDLGRVERALGPKPDDGALRAELIAELRKSGTLSKNKLAKNTKRKKEAVCSEVDAMVKLGLAVARGTGFALVETVVEMVVPKAVQTAIAGTT